MEGYKGIPEYRSFEDFSSLPNEDRKKLIEGYCPANIPNRFSETSPDNCFRRANLSKLEEMWYEIYIRGCPENQEKFLEEDKERAEKLFGVFGDLVGYETAGMPTIAAPGEGDPEERVRGNYKISRVLS